MGIQRGPIEELRASYKAEFLAESANQLLAMRRSAAKLALYDLLLDGENPRLVEEKYDTELFDMRDPHGGWSVLHVQGYLVFYRELESHLQPMFDGAVILVSWIGPVGDATELR